MKKRSQEAAAKGSTTNTSNSQTQPPRRRRRFDKPSCGGDVDGAPAPAAVDAGAGEVKRCDWVSMYKGAAAAEYVRYHDEEWGRPEHDETKLFELLILEGAQAGLSWSTILAKREAYRRAFDGFDPSKVAAYDEHKLEWLMSAESGVVRHRGKLEAAVQNAKVFLQLQQEHGSFDSYVWGFVPYNQPIVNNWTSLSQVPTKTPESEALSKALQQAGMKFVGPTIMYAYMQATGMVDDHLVSCHCRTSKAAAE